MRHNRNGRRNSVTAANEKPTPARGRRSVTRRGSRNRTNRASTSVPGATVTAYSHREVDMEAIGWGGLLLLMFLAAVVGRAFWGDKQ